MEGKAEVWIPGCVGSPGGREDSHRETGGLREVARASSGLTSYFQPRQVAEGSQSLRLSSFQQYLNAWPGGDSALPDLGLMDSF